MSASPSRNRRWVVGDIGLNLREQRDPSVPKDEGVFSWCHLCSPVFSPGLIRPRLALAGLRPRLWYRCLSAGGYLLDRWSGVRRRSSRVHSPLAPPPGLHCSRLPEGSLDRLLVPIIAVLNCSRDATARDGVCQAALKAPRRRISARWFDPRRSGPRGTAGTAGAPAA